MRTNTIKTSRIDQMTADQTLAAGITQYAKQIGTLTIQSKPFKPGDLVKILDARIAAQQPVAAARANLSKVVATANTELASTRVVVKFARQILQRMFNDDPTVLNALGLAPLAATEPTPATKVAAAAKAKATRAARGTKGKKAKLAITAPAAAQAAPAAATPATPSTPAPAAKPQS